MVSTIYDRSKNLTKGRHYFSKILDFWCTFVVLYFSQAKRIAAKTI